jgi:hypothetical protein
VLAYTEIIVYTRVFEQNEKRALAELGREKIENASPKKLVISTRAGFEPTLPADC